MLVNFRFENCRSFYDETVLSMQAVKDTTLKEINTFYVSENILPEGDNELIKSAAIFGGNASGKSNILKAFSYMINVIRFSSAQLPVVEKNEYFIFQSGAENKKSLYEVEFIHNNIFYKYGFELCGGVVCHEWLSKRENRRLTPVFEREYEKLKNVIKVPRKILDLIKIPDNTLFLSVGNNFNLEINNYLNDVLSWFLNVLIVFENTNNSLEIYTLKNEYKEKALEILKKADIGISNFEVIKDKIANFNNLFDINAKIQAQPMRTLVAQLKQENENLYNIDLETDFNIYDENNNIIGEKPVLLYKEDGFNSEGTTRLFCYLGWILAALDEGRTIFIDEIDSKLHFLVTDYIINMFNSIENNPKNAQLIFTAHNVLLMDELRRDQIYFTSKDEYGKSSLVSLADYKGVRKDDLFSKRYLAGFYANLPNLY